MIRGKIWVDREVRVRDIICGKSPLHKNKNGRWINIDDPDAVIEETTLGVLFNRAGFGDVNKKDCEEK